MRSAGLLLQREGVPADRAALNQPLWEPCWKRLTQSRMPQPLPQLSRALTQQPTRPLRQPWAALLILGLVVLIGAAPLQALPLAIATAPAIASVSMTSGDVLSDEGGAGGTAAAAASLAAGAQLFEAHCVGCHVQGGNVIRRGRTLKLAALERADLASPEAITRVASEGLGQMSGYGSVLGAQGADQVAAWVWQQALAGWPRAPRPNRSDS